MFTLNCKGSLLIIDRPLVMGIINVTPDSFYSQSRSETVANALAKASQMMEEGADILDIGGQSTRPDGHLLSETEELARVIPVIHAIHQSFPETILSVDTFYPLVAKEAVAAGAKMINDISGGTYHTEMLTTVAGLNVPYICMHSPETIAKMHQKEIQGNITLALVDYFKERVSACKLAGIKDIIIDPGIGFGKTLEQNFQLIKELSVFKIFDKPLLLGISRKSFIYKTLNISADDALNGTTVIHTIGIQHGASILRVHDVKEAVEAIKLTEYVNKKA
jgi:dihydropteroate synthase